jgi:hypothetical protein
MTKSNSAVANGLSRFRALSASRLVCLSGRMTDALTENVVSESMIETKFHQVVTGTVQGFAPKQEHPRST